MFRKTLLTTVLILISAISFSQSDNDSIRCRKNKHFTIAGSSIFFAGSMTGLYQLWYADYPQSSFHFFNDNNEWMQMDKIGHGYSAYQLSTLGYQVSKQACFNENQAIWLGGSYGLLFLTTVEIFDGFSSGWGASWGDMAANTGGFLLFAGQQHFWKEQKIMMKFSAFPTDYAQYRPGTLGNSIPTRLLKDYNGQTYWLSFSPASFLKNKDGAWPKWLCFSVGYGADGMLGGSENPTFENGQLLPVFQRTRQIYLSLDVDTKHIKTSSRAMKVLLTLLNTVKMPLPALEYSTSGKVKLHPLYF